MERNLRYSRLPNSEPNSEPNSPVRSIQIEMIEDSPSNRVLTEQNNAETTASAPEIPAADTLSPPPYSSLVENEGENSNVEDPKYDPSLPPSYSIATVLPTYEQVEQLKRQEVIQEIGLTDPEAVERGDNLLGTDFMFLCAFFVSFLFNWIGFLMLMCFCPTIAGRYGALAGFGLSLAKWTLIVKHSTELVSMDNNWLWWLILAFGVLICVRAVLQYLNVKREWHLLTRATQQRLMYFY